MKNNKITKLKSKLFYKSLSKKLNISENSTKKLIIESMKEAKTNFLFESKERKRLFKKVLNEVSHSDPVIYVSTTAAADDARNKFGVDIHTNLISSTVIGIWSLARSISASHEFNDDVQVIGFYKGEEELQDSQEDDYGEEGNEPTQYTEDDYNIEDLFTLVNVETAKSLPTFANASSKRK